jgi:alanine dehydrogenase
VTGKKKGRSNSEQITLFGGSGTGGSSGLGIQFAAVAHRIYESAVQKGIGREIPTDWFLEDVHP